MQESSLNATPRIIVIDEFLSSEECLHMIELARPLMKSSVVVDKATGDYVQHASRSSSNSYISAGSDSIADNIAKRLADFASIPVENGYAFKAGQITGVTRFSYFRNSNS
ncbi:MAG: hypothetical protein K9L22_12565 [Methylococcaceae bacterium]|nr:hypothetical protein [Methylococcaceae bacterium]